MDGGGWNHFARTTPIGGFALPPSSASARLRLEFLECFTATTQNSDDHAARVVWFELFAPSLRSRFSISRIKSLCWIARIDWQNSAHSESFIGLSLSGIVGRTFPSAISLFGSNGRGRPFYIVCALQLAQHYFSCPSSHPSPTERFCHPIHVPDHNGSGPFI